MTGTDPMAFDGRWAITIATPVGRQEVVLDIVHRDGVLSGTATQGAETVPFIDPVADGDRLTWSQKITKPMSMAVRFDLVRDGDALSGKAKPGILPATAVTGIRVA